MNKKKTLLILFCIIIPIFIILFSYKAVLLFTNLNENQQITIDFLQNKEELSLAYTENEISHLNDVKRVIQNTEIIFYTLLLILTLIFTYHHKDQKQIRKLLKYGGITTISFIGLILIFFILSFNFLFTFFHKIFFPQGNWTFPLNSQLIATFPFEFFLKISLNIFILSFILGSFLIFISFLLKHEKNNN